MSKKFLESEKLKTRALSCIPHQTGTFSRGANSFVEGVFPTYVQTAEGSHFTDLDGNRYLDYLCGLGPITLGYNYKSVNDAIIEQLKQGILFSFAFTVIYLASFLSTIVYKIIIFFSSSHLEKILSI